MTTTTRRWTDDDYVATPDLRILGVLAGFCGYHGKLWCFPNQRTIRNALQRRYGRTLTRRSINRHLGALQRDHYIERKRRHRRGPTGRIDMHSTIYVLKARTVRALKDFGSYMLTVAAHPWARRWLSAVPTMTQCAAPSATSPRPEEQTHAPPA